MVKSSFSRFFSHFLPSVHLLHHLVASGVGRTLLLTILSYNDTFILEPSSHMFIRDPHETHVWLKTFDSNLVVGIHNRCVVL